MKPRLFIDGEHGTTGLQIRERLASRSDIEVLSIPHAERRDTEKRRDMLAGCDVAILCLPDDAAREAVSLIEASGNEACKIIDTSTAHRTSPDWVFGFAELEKGQAEAVSAARRVSNPGCYSTGAIALLKPLISTGLMAADFPVTINAVSGYTGGGKQLIAQMEDKNHEDHIATSYHAYALPLKHKHVPEIMVRAGLDRRPVFTPAVGRFAQGMLVNIPLHLDSLNGAGKPADIHDALADHYTGCKHVTVASREEASKTAQLRPEDFAGRNDMKLWVFGDPETGHVNLVAQLDNLGKGASGAAVQNLDLMLGNK
jgi:N-acetyl-gamma-glutamyl-phosphate reductase